MGGLIPRGSHGEGDTDAIRQCAAGLVRLHDDVDRAQAARDGSDAADREWRLAAQRFREATRDT